MNSVKAPCPVPSEPVPRPQIFGQRLSKLTCLGKTYKEQVTVVALSTESDFPIRLSFASPTPSTSATCAQICTLSLIVACDSLRIMCISGNSVSQ